MTGAGSSASVAHGQRALPVAWTMPTEDERLDTGSVSCQTVDGDLPGAAVTDGARRAGHELVLTGRIPPMMTWSSCFR
jgi:hypothetical protein